MAEKSTQPRDRAGSAGSAGSAGNADMPPLDAPVEMPIGYMLWGHTLAQAVYIVAKLGIADKLQDGPKTAAELAQAVGADPVNLSRVLRALTAFALFTEDEQGRFAPTARGELFASHHPLTRRPMALLQLAPFLWPVWGNMLEAVVTGRPAFDAVYGQPFFAYLAANPDDGALFNAAMTGGAASTEAIVQAFDWSRFRKVVDIGGGHGGLLRTLLSAYPHLTGVLADQPHVVDGADTLRESDVADRCEFVGIDMFEAVPPGGDCYVLKEILHDWDDGQSLKILRHCRRAMAAGATVLHIGTVLLPSNYADPGKLVDLTMMTMLTGRERTEADFRELYAGAGFDLVGTHWIAPGYGLVEGRAV